MMDWETPSKEWIATLACSTPSVVYVTNLLRISNRELRRLIALYWPDLKPATLEALHKFLCPQRKLYCNIRIALPADLTEQGEPGEPPFVPFITEPIDMVMSNVACQISHVASQ
jgi:hypothetical protein